MRYKALLLSLMLLAVASCEKSQELDVVVPVGGDEPAQEQPIEEEPLEEVVLPEANMQFPQASADEAAVLGTLRDFNFNLLRAVMANKEGVFGASDAYMNQKNVAVSPVSCAICMAMLANSLDDCSAGRINEILGAESTDVLNGAVKTILGKTNFDFITLKMLNNAWIFKDLEVKASYKEMMSDIFGADVNSADIRSKAGIDEINAWCDKMTEGMIPSIISAPNEKAIAYILQVLYYNSGWAYPLSDAGKNTFHGSNGDKITDFMKLKVLNMSVAQGSECTVVKLPMMDFDVHNFYLIIPAEGKTPGALMENLTAEGWDDMKRQNVGSYELSLTMPQFRFESENMLMYATEWMGMPSYSYYWAMTDERHEKSAVNLLQKVVIDVNTEGVTCAAVTAGGVSSSTPHEVKPLEITVDRPFAFILEDQRDGMVLSAGIFNNP